MSIDERVESDKEAGGAGLHRANQQQSRMKRLQRFRSGDSSLNGVVFHKVCCVCGAVLNHKQRFKDHEGRYWCATCNEADQEKVKPLPCSDCGIEMSRMDLKEVSGLLLCPVCVSKAATQGRAVADVRLRALAHSKEQDAMHATSRKVAKSRSDPLMMAIWVLAAAVVVALIAVVALWVT